MSDKQLLLARDKVCHPAPLSVKIATGDGGPENQYNFTQYASNDHHHNLSMFEHVAGCRYCEEVGIGHYLLPSGKLAHFCLLDTTVKGHQVDLIPPREVPFETHEWFDTGLPVCTLLAADPSRRLLSASPDLPMDLWCPIPLLPAATGKDQKYVLEWAVGQEGKTLEERTVCLMANVVRIFKTEVVTEVVPPKPKPKKR